MKELILVRHAKSDWENINLKDVDRYLSERGYKDAYDMSEWFLNNKKKPDVIVASTATRALSTSLIFTRTLNFDLKHFKLEPRIYERDVKNLMNLIKLQETSIHSLMLFGHNPGFTNLCNHLAEKFELDNLPTCGIVSLNFEEENWNSIRLKTGKLNYYQFPKNFKD